VLGEQTEPKGRRLILHIDRDSLVTIQKTGNKIFTGLKQGTVKVLKDPETATSDSGSEEEGNVKYTPSNDRKGTVGAGEENAPNTLPDLSDQWTSSKDTQTDSKGKAEKKGMETDPPSQVI
jgi:hypothetical protein